MIKETNNVKVHIESFDPEIDDNSKVLILGTMPSKESLNKGEYYANPRNQFWPIISSVLGINPELPYPERRTLLIKSGIALWDVLASCERPDSSDSKITNEVANNFKELFEDYKSIRYVFFNGTNAAGFFKKHVAIELPFPSGIILPSTSPAHTITLEKKVAAWSIIKDCIACPKCGSDMVVPIIYGMPNHEAFEEETRGEIRLGGCCVGPDDPAFACNSCDHEWGTLENCKWLG